jgi:hypothetical protein
MSRIRARIFTDWALPPLDLWKDELAAAAGKNDVSALVGAIAS